MSTDLKGFLRSMLLEAGASAVGFAEAGEVDRHFMHQFEEWIDRGACGELDYMRRYADLRADPRKLFPGCRTVVSVAWNYLPAELRDPSLPFIARYAYGRDYHKALRSILRPICREVEMLFNCGWRICIDSAPINERYWAVKAGVGFIGRNGCLIVPGQGSWMFLSEILLTAEVEYDQELKQKCIGCEACRRICPGGAIGEDATVDTRRCLSSATIEGTPYCGSLPEKPHLLGCDRCQEVCPHNRSARASGWVSPLEDILTLSEEGLQDMGEERFLHRFAGTCLIRPGLKHLLENLSDKGC